NDGGRFQQGEDLGRLQHRVAQVGTFFRNVRLFSCHRPVSAKVGRLGKASLPKLRVRFREGVDGEFQIFAGMGGGNLGADTRGAVRHDWVEKTYHVNTLLEHARGELLRESGVAEHDRDDRVGARFDCQAALHQGGAEIVRVLLEFVAQL